MKEIKGDMWSFLQRVDAICITTNGFLKQNKLPVMGRGCALQAKKRYTQIEKNLSQHLLQNGNNVGVILKDGRTDIVSFPVKPRSAPLGSPVVEHMKGKKFHSNIVPGWACKADLELIRTSALQLKELADKNNWKYVVLPRPGSGAGELNWSDVKPVIEDILDDRFAAITY